MSVTWSDLDRPGDPVLARPETFEGIAGQFDRIDQNVSSVAREFDGIRFGDGAFAGQAAQAFVSKIADVDNYLDDFSDVSRQLVAILRSHAERLRDLRAAADAALARAQTNWHQRETHTNERIRAERDVSSLQWQLDSLVDEDGGSQRDLLTRQYDSAQDRRTSSQRQAWAAEARLDEDRQAWDRLHEREGQLSDDTANRIRSVDLESLANPSWLSQMQSEAGAAVGWAWNEFRDDLSAFAVAVGSYIADQLDGPLGNMMVALYESLDTMLLALGAVQGVLSLVNLALVATGVGAPIALGVIALLGTVTLVMAAAKLGLGAGLMATNDLRPGQRQIGGVDLALDGLSLVTAGAMKGADHLAKARYYNMPISALEKQAAVANRSSSTLAGLELFESGRAVMDGAPTVRDGVETAADAVADAHRTTSGGLTVPMLGLRLPGSRAFGPTHGIRPCLAPTGWRN